MATAWRVFASDIAGRFGRRRRRLSDTLPSASRSREVRPMRPVRHKIVRENAGKLSSLLD
jgi:hypothetical protein